MCGISYSRINFKSKKTNVKNIKNKFIKYINNNKFLLALEEVRKLRCNYVFVNILLDNQDVLSTIEQLKTKVENIKKKKINENNYNVIKDINWVLNSEIIFRCKRIKEFLYKNKITLSDKSIIFTRYFLYTISSINYLESRGRDSLGISLNFKSKKKINLKKKFGNNRNVSFVEKKLDKKNFFSNLTIKYSNRIGYSGENTEKILNIIQKKIKLSKINFENFHYCEIFAHTRWASVGEVNISNSHPLVQKKANDFFLIMMNGDINNFNQIKSNLIEKNKYYLSDKNCTNDLQPIPSLIINKNYNINNLLNGSYVLFFFDSRKPENCFILKKGSQGMYCAIDEDGYPHFASDIYGLINKSNKFKKIDFNGLLKLNEKNISKISALKFTSTELMTNDLSQRGLDTFFMKEINDTEMFLKRTIDRYTDLNSYEYKNLNNLFNKSIQKKLIKKRIKNIIFTGMGSCYTAAVGISKYLGKKLDEVGYKHIKVEATIASEGSGFYLSKKMSDTIIVVIAQSGTTIDTNVFAKLAKERGAHTFAIVNKKQGDITFIVDKSIYLGNGRDIEISVPSTKTYTCHLLTGFIFSEKLIEILKGEKNTRFFSLIDSIYKHNNFDNFIKKTLNKLQFINLNPFKYNNWVVVYDDSINSFSALELRIKLSECCYKSIQYIHVNLFNKSKFKNTLVFYLTSSQIRIKKKSKDNFYFIISSKKIKNSFNTFNLFVEYKNYYDLIINYSLSLQLVAYKVSRIIDEASKNKIFLKKNYNKIVNFIIDKKDTNYLNKLNTEARNKYVIDRLKRPLDTIKHQAKTVTVGAIRSIKFKEKIIHEGKIEIENNNFEKYKNLISNFNNNINIISNENGEIIKYYIGNLIEYHNNIYKNQKHFKLYNFKKNLIPSSQSKNTNIIITDKKIKFLNKKKTYTIDNLNSYKILNTILPADLKSKKNEIIFQNAKKIMMENNFEYEIKFEKIFNKFNNIKFLGSGINYLVAKKYAFILSKIFNRSIAFDVIENHKHIDISSESLVLVFASNIDRKGFQRDVYSELEKFISHKNEPIIFTNLNNNIFDNLDLKNNIIQKRIFKLPTVPEVYSLSIFDFFFEKFILN